ncbi:hypothetical protein EI94DRAFT_1698848 [Lactarius quietus]|nr:hypothetical protein EI94DRAFT_1698848 [Lactarius quietus]
MSIMLTCLVLAFLFFAVCSCVWGSSPPVFPDRDFGCAIDVVIPVRGWKVHFDSSYAKYGLGLLIMTGRHAADVARRFGYSEPSCGKPSRAGPRRGPATWTSKKALPFTLNDEKKVDAPKEVIPNPTPPTKKLFAKKKASKWILWKLWFNTYRKLFTFVFTLNMIGITLAASGHFPYAEKLYCELFGRFLYLFVNTCFAKWMPLWWRLGCTSVLQHPGGIHSGCALSGVGWLILKVVNNFRHHPIDSRHWGNDDDRCLCQRHKRNPLVSSSATTVSLDGSASFLLVRQPFQHPFQGANGHVSGVFTILSDLYDSETQTWNLSVIHIIRQQDFWFVMGMTTLIFIQWLCVREVPVDIELPSPKVAIIRFKRGMQQGLLGRISTMHLEPFREKHPLLRYQNRLLLQLNFLLPILRFVTTTLKDSLGDFTRGLVNDLPRTLWTRELKFAGVSNTSTLYKRGVRIHGHRLYTVHLPPITPLQGNPPSSSSLPLDLGSDREKTFGPTITGLIHRNISPERPRLWDSKLRGGRPDTMKIQTEAYHAWGAEVVFRVITSNYGGNSEIMQGCKEAGIGIPAFGTLWDFLIVDITGTSEAVANALVEQTFTHMWRHPAQSHHTPS